MSASGPRVTYYTSLHVLSAWSIMKHEKTCTVADARIYIFFRIMRKKERYQSSLQRATTLLSPSQTETQQSVSHAADGTACHASLEILESSSAVKSVSLPPLKPQLGAFLHTCLQHSQDNVGSAQGCPWDVVQKGDLASLGRFMVPCHAIRIYAIPHRLQGWNVSVLHLLSFVAQFGLDRLF